MSDGEARAAGHRHARLESILREELVTMLRDEIEDPRLADVAVTGVSLSPDYHNARVRFALRGEGRTHDEHDRVAGWLGLVAGFLRSRLAEALDLKRTPNLRFFPDPDAGLLPDADHDDDDDEGWQRGEGDEGAW
jgi:ribosome-binding factor A